MRQIVVMRHAKARPSAPSDHERPLDPRGRDDAAEAGRWLAAHGRVPDHALVSAALRTRETYQAVADAAGWPLEATYDEGLYAAGPDTVIDLVSSVDPAVQRLLVIGHNPTISYLAQLLDDGEGAAEVIDQLVLGFPTCALAVLDCPGEWTDLAPGTASVTAFHVGRAED